MTRATPSWVAPRRRFAAALRFAVVHNVGFAIALVFGIGCHANSHPQDNSNTNWLSMCQSDDDCAGIAHCICGSCTTKDIDEDSCEAREPEPPEPSAPDDAADDDEPKQPDASGSTPIHDALIEPSNMNEKPPSEYPVDNTQEPVAGSPGPIIEQVRPRVPDVEGECPDFVEGQSSITYQGLEGIMIDAGPKGTGESPLIFYWHGTGSTANEYLYMMAQPALDDIRARGGIIVSFQNTLGTGENCSGTFIFSVDDFKIADQIAACAVRDHGIDPKRIYTSGCSAGGLQAGCMAVRRASYIAAVVTNSGGLMFPQMFDTTEHVPAVMAVHGGGNDIVAVSFTETSRAFEQQITDAGGFAVDCDHGANHCGAPQDLQLMGWEFMKAHPYGTSPSPYIDGLPSGFPSYCRIY